MTEAERPEEAVIYARISDDPDGDAVGVDRQLIDCRALAQRRGYQVVAEFPENDVSASEASEDEREKYDAMLAGVRSGKYRVILAYSRSRLIRDLNDFIDLKLLWKETGLRVETVVSGDVDLSTADGELVATILTAVDVAEARRVQERLNRANRHRVEVLGEPTNGMKYGWRRGLGGRLEEDPEAAAVVREIARRIVAGESLNSIKKDLIARAVPTPTVAEIARRGKAGEIKEPKPKNKKTKRQRIPFAVVKEIADRTIFGEPLPSIVADLTRRGERIPQWSHQTLASVVRRPSNVARIEYQGQTHPGTFPPLLDVDTFDRVVLILGDEGRKSWRRPEGMRQRDIRHFLSGTSFCGKPDENGTRTLTDGTRVCGARERVRTDSSSQKARQSVSKATYKSYWCPRCNGTSCRTYRVEEHIETLVLARLMAADAPAVLSGDAAEVAAQEARISGLEGRRRRLARVYLDLGISEEDYDLQRAEIQAEIEDATRLKHRAGPAPELAQWLDGEGPEVTWQTADASKRRDLVALLMDVYILPGTRGRNEFDPDARLRIEWKM